MLGRLKKLPEVTQQILQLAACVGAEFNLNTLSIISDKTPKAVFLNLLTAIQGGLIQPLSELDKDLLIQEYRFLHDRVQQAAYILIDEAYKEVVHLQIGRNLLEKTLQEQLSDRLFEIVDHLNQGIGLVTNQAERNEIARLNLIAGQKAKAAIAYNVSKKYLATGRAWLAASSWRTNYDLTLELYLETTEVEFLCGEFEQVESWGVIVLEKAKTVLDTIKVYEVKIQTCIAQVKLLEAIDTALQILQQLEISFPETPTHSDIRLELDALASLLSEKPITDLIHLSPMTEPEKLATMRILSSITITAYIAAPNLMPLLASKQVNLSIQYGNAFLSPFAYAIFGMILCGTLGNIESGYQFGNIESGYEFGQLALELLSQPSTHSLRARTLFIVHNSIIHHKKHLKGISEPLLEAYQSGLETGDLEFAAYCAHVYCFQSYATGKELVELERNMAIYGEAIRQIKQKTVLAWSQTYRQTIANLMGHSVNPTRLIGEFYNEEKGLPQHKAANDGIAIFGVYFNKLFLCYLFSDYPQAIENSILAERYLSRTTATPLEPLYYLYDSLVRLATYLGSSTQVQKEILQRVAVRQEKMKQWAYYAPMNCLHRYHLVQAEKARVLGQWFDAEEFYEQAILGARENEYIQEEALAYELAAKFYLSRGREKFAQTYMKEAHYCYERWGAIAKVRDLETRYPQLFPQSSDATSPTPKTFVTTSNHSPKTFDLAAVMRASQAISSEIELDKLLSSLMKILIENAGAQIGFLILENSGKWMIEASGELKEGENTYATRLLQSIPTANHLPESIINYVIRTHECVILNDATREGNFIHEPYIQHNQIKSILCLPLLNQGKLVGVLYLENKLAAGAFTPQRSQVLNLLSSQAAIAIENARLYSKLRKSESRMKQFLEAVPVGIGVLDAAGRVYYVNQRGIQLMGKGIDPSVAPEQIPEIYQFYLAGTVQNYPTEKLPAIRALSGECTTVDDLEIHQNSAIVPVEVWGTPIFDEQGNVAYAIAAFQDITERKQAEKLLADYHQTLEQRVIERTLLLSQEIEERQRVENALRQSEEQRRLTMDFTYIGSWNWNIIENTTHWNDNHARLLGLVPSEVESSYQAWRDRVHPEDIHRVEQAITAALATHTDFEAEYRVIYPNGNIHWLVGRGRGIYNAAGQPVRMLGVILDISELRNAALRERKRAEEASILEERNRMAREIHDTLAQSFTGVIIHARTAANKITVDPQKAQAHLAQVQNLAQTGLSEARRSVEALRRPYLLENSDLLSAFKHLTSQLESSTGITIMCEAIGIPYPLPSEVENNLLRIGQEALTNALKYAQATKIRVELIYQSTQCILRIKDDGQGFAIDRDSSHNGFGLLGMAERADLIGAQIQIQSALGQGTEIAVSVNQQEKPS
ncbi:PAS domain-containing protein [Nostoc flagelliforme FACHB-838]|uniref:PAS domain-containing protein n=2 Tax=Nostoc flagelliforme TaxID=1306274 RepID=A0ABR8E4F0_9NOSO|nr:PAS domain-containing protein [Nostoc flagelliforme FACHB-838]